MYLEDACFELSPFSVDAYTEGVGLEYIIDFLEACDFNIKSLAFYYHFVWTKYLTLLTDDGIMAAVRPV